MQVNSAFEFVSFITVVYLQPFFRYGQWLF